PMRRALEAVWPGIRTLGFAGFFGLPIAYTPLATDARRPQLPGRLAPAIEVSDRIEGVGAQTGAAHDLDRAAGAARGRQF
ncbi:putative inorganic carbon transporter subunit DabA, partial [Acinetobacter baumannii]